jgi:hypothetical protein
MFFVGDCDEIIVFSIALFLFDGYPSFSVRRHPTCACLPVMLNQCGTSSLPRVERLRSKIPLHGTHTYIQFSDPSSGKRELESQAVGRILLILPKYKPSVPTFRPSNLQSFKFNF